MTIMTADEYALARRDLEELADAQVDTPEGQRFETLSQALDEYDAKGQAVAAEVIPG